MQSRSLSRSVKLTGRGLIFEGPSSRKLMWVLISPAAEVTWSPSPSVSVTVTPTVPLPATAGHSACWSRCPDAATDTAPHRPGRSADRAQSQTPPGRSSTGFAASTPTVPITRPLPSSDSVIAVPSVRVRPDAALVTSAAESSCPRRPRQRRRPSATRCCSPRSRQSSARHCPAKHREHRYQPPCWQQC